MAILRTLVAVFVLLLAANASADTDVGSYTLSGQVEVGGQNTSGDHDSAKFKEYRDVREWIANSHFLLQEKDGTGYLRGMFRDPGQGDQRYRLEGGQYGHWGVFGSFKELPHHFSNDAESPYRGIRDADLTLSFARPSGDLGADVADTLRDLDVQFRTKEGEAGAYVKLPHGFGLRSGYRLIDKRGNIFRGGLGHNFGFVSSLGTFVAADFAGFASRVDEQIHEITGDVEWTGSFGSFNANYTGSLYDQQVNPSLTIDNPFSETDGADQSARWRQALAPDNSAHTISLSGAVPLPTPFPMRFTGTVSYGMRKQNENFIPMTINSFYDGDDRLTPSQDDLDGEINIWLGDVRFHARPVAGLDIDVRYRIYDYDNDSDRVRLDAVVVNDTAFSDEFPDEPDRISARNEYTRHNLDVGATYDLSDATTLGLGWEWEQWRRSSDRQAHRTNEQGPHVSLDWRPGPWGQVRSRYTYTDRTNSEYEPFAHFFKTHNEDVSGDDAPLAVFPALRRYPQEDRTRQDASLIAQFFPCEPLEINVNGGLTLDDYDHTEFGLTDDKRFFTGLDVLYQPRDWLRLGASYTFDYSRQKQTSRQRPVLNGFAVDDPMLNWQVRNTERAHNVGAEMWLEILPEQLELELAYLFQRGSVRTRAGGSNVEAVDWPTVRNTLHQVGAAFLYHVTEKLTVRPHYRYERYSQRDFQFDDINAYEPDLSALSIFLANEVDSYSAHTYGLSLIYEF